MSRSIKKTPIMTVANAQKTTFKHQHNKAIRQSAEACANSAHKRKTNKEAACAYSKVYGHAEDYSEKEYNKKLKWMFF